MRPDRKFWSGKRVLVTGHTGFKGAWLCFWLQLAGAKVTGVSLPPKTEPSLFKLLALDELVDSRIADIRDSSLLFKTLQDCGPDIVFHLAAQALVRESYKTPAQTFETNFGGTCKLLEALRHSPNTKAAVIVTTDKVYRNLEKQLPFVESDELGGHDPYSASKAAAELLVESYRESFLRQQGLAIATARAGNVIGGGDWSSERLIPDCVSAWARGDVVDIRMPDAIRPWQHVLDPLAGYLRLAEKLWVNPALATSYNFGPDAEGSATVREAVQLAMVQWGPTAKAQFAETISGPKESKVLRLSNAKARADLDVQPVWPLAASMACTVDWYKNFSTQSARDLCTGDIAAFEHGQA